MIVRVYGFVNNNKWIFGSKLMWGIPKDYSDVISTAIYDWTGELLFSYSVPHTY